jgi:hypothetical protein
VNGTHIGRPLKLAPHQQQEVRKRYERGDTLVEIAKTYEGRSALPEIRAVFASVSPPPPLQTYIYTRLGYMIFNSNALRG